MFVVLVRHFETLGNQFKRYIGSTDEEIVVTTDMIEIEQYPRVSRVYCSPLLRCRETSAILYPDQIPIVQNDFRECHFGDFENKNYEELCDRKEYQEWMGSGGKIAFPGGEDPMEFRLRCKRAFAEVMEECCKDCIDSVAIVVHGGTIMSIMEEYDEKANSFYDYQVKNGDGYVLEVDSSGWNNGRRQFHTCEQIHCIRKNHKNS